MGQALVTFSTSVASHTSAFKISLNCHLVENVFAETMLLEMM